MNTPWKLGEQTRSLLQAPITLRLATSEMRKHYDMRGRFVSLAVTFVQKSITAYSFEVVFEMNSTLLCKVS